ncbi:MAG: hypothetical protein IT532_15300 [Burkholderiales bacterium]|nr:hypothetical protein [Burkholderiales bacterium]
MTRIPAIALDFARPAAALGRAGLVLLVLGAAGLAAAGLHYRAVAQEARVREARVTQLREMAQRTLPALESGADASPEAREQVRRANEVLGQINVPWSELFAAIESAQHEDIALLAVQPDARARSVSISGQAQDMTGVLAYMGRLEAGGRLREVMLIEHEIKVKEPAQPTRFTLNARWMESQ